LPGPNFGCQPSRGPNEPTEQSKGSARVSRRVVDDRPPLELVERSGDPRPALAFAVAHDGGSVASVAVAAVLDARLRAKGYDALRARPQALGLTLELLPGSSAQVRKFFSDVRTALTSPLGDGEPARSALREAFSGLRARTWLGPGDAAVANCSGELGVPAGTQLPDPDSGTGRAQIDAWLAEVSASASVAFAAVGPADMIEQAGEGLEESPPWPLEEPVDDSWPERDSLLVDYVPEGARRLSIALRVDDADAALVAAEQLARPSSALSLRLAALSIPFRLERAAASARPRGGCLRVDLVGPRADPGPDADAVAGLLVTAEGEMRASLAAAAGRRAPDGVARFVDPRDAAALAAWRALSAEQASEDPVRTVAYLGHVSERDRLVIAPAVATIERRLARTNLDLVRRDEPGQGELWVLLASPCGTASEDAGDAGSHSVMLRALAREASGTNDVQLEPWVAVDGAGLLAHAPRRDPSESAAALARRIGSALGRALLASSPSGPTLASVRAGLLDEIGPEPRPGYWLTLDAMSPGHPSWLEPRGTFAALSDAGQGSFELSRRAFVRGPLRVAVLTNAGSGQADIARASIERWLGTERLGTEACPARSPATPRVGELTLQTSSGQDAEGAYVAVALPGLSGPVRRQAEATLLLLNRRGGLLDQALSSMAARAEARLVGGPTLGGLVIRVSADRGVEAPAVAQVRALLERLGRGAVSQEDVVLAERELSRAELETSLDPRRRIIDLFRGTTQQPPLDLATLRAFQARLAGSHHTVVYVRSPD
jgi:hypothetical protein